MYEKQIRNDTVNLIIENAFSGGAHSQATLAEYYASGYLVSKCLFTAFSWAFVASKNGYQQGAYWEKEIWKEFKSEAEQRKAMVSANELWVKILGTTKRG